MLAVAGPAVPASAAAPCSPDMMPPSFGRLNPGGGLVVRILSFRFFLYYNYGHIIISHAFPEDFKQKAVSHEN
jgi:hypothetical protein